MILLSTFPDSFTNTKYNKSQVCIFIFVIRLMVSSLSLVSSVLRIFRMFMCTDHDSRRRKKKHSFIWWQNKCTYTLHNTHCIQKWKQKTSLAIKMTTKMVNWTKRIQRMTKEIQIHIWFGIVVENRILYISTLPVLMFIDVQYCYCFSFFLYRVWDFIIYQE